MKSILTIEEYEYICREISRFGYNIKDVKYIKKTIEKFSFNISYILIVFNNNTEVRLYLSTYEPFRSCYCFSKMGENRCYTLKELGLMETL